MKSANTSWALCDKCGAIKGCDPKAECLYCEEETLHPWSDLEVGTHPDSQILLTAPAIGV